MINLIAMLLCVWSMFNAIEAGQKGWAYVAGFFALLNGLALIF